MKKLKLGMLYLFTVVVLGIWAVIIVRLFFAGPLEQRVTSQPLKQELHYE